MSATTPAGTPAFTEAVTAWRVTKSPITKYAAAVATAIQDGAPQKTAQRLLSRCKAALDNFDAKRDLVALQLTNDTQEQWFSQVEEEYHDRFHIALSSYEDHYGVSFGGQQPAAGAAAPAAAAPRQGEKLPTLSLLIFAGDDPSDYLPWRESFHSKVLNQPHLPDDSKFRYLEQATSHGAFKIVSSIEPGTGDRTDRAMQALDGKYKTDHSVMPYILRKLYLPPQSNNASDLQFHFSQAIQNLRSLEIFPANEPGLTRILVNFIEQGMPKSVHSHWRTHVDHCILANSAFKPTVEDILEYFRRQSEHDDRVSFTRADANAVRKSTTAQKQSNSAPQSRGGRSGGSGGGKSGGGAQSGATGGGGGNSRSQHRPPNSRPPPKDYNVDSSTPTEKQFPCAFCASIHSGTCKRARELSVPDRWAKLRESNGCPLCLRSGHIGKETCRLIPGKHCPSCGKPHHALLHSDTEVPVKNAAKKAAVHVTTSQQQLPWTAAIAPPQSK